MEDMKTFECAICGKMYNSIRDRIACETKCLVEQEEMKKMQDESVKKELEAKINSELELLIQQYDKVAHMIGDYYEKYNNEDIYSKVVNRGIPRTFFDFIF